MRPKHAKYHIMISLIPYKAIKWQYLVFPTSFGDSELCEKTRRAETCTVQPVIVTSSRQLQEFPHSLVITYLHPAIDSRNLKKSYFFLLLLFNSLHLHKLQHFYSYPDSKIRHEIICFFKRDMDYQQVNLLIYIDECA